MRRPFRKKNQTTTKSIQSLCAHFLTQINRSCEERTDLILLAWPEIIGTNLMPMAKAKRFVNGVLEVDVSNSALLSILSMQEKRTLLKKIREKFPKTDIKDIRFRIG